MNEVRHRLGGLLPGAQERRRQIAAYSEAWRRGNADAVDRPGPLWVVLGDSTAQAVGASSPPNGYVGVVAAWFDGRGGDRWRVVNLSRSGATAAAVLTQQVPELRSFPSATLVSCAVGANDLLRRSATLEERLAGIAESLPRGSLLANLPRGLRERRAADVNRVIARLVQRHHLRLVDLWSRTGPPWRGKFAGDGFHPSDLGYRDWAAAFIDALERPQEP